MFKQPLIARSLSINTKCNCKERFNAITLPKISLYIMSLCWICENVFQTRDVNVKNSWKFLVYKKEQLSPLNYTVRVTTVELSTPKDLERGGGYHKKFKVDAPLKAFLQIFLYIKMWTVPHL